jgi:hypothetical protein
MAASEPARQPDAPLAATAPVQPPGAPVSTSTAGSDVAPAASAAAVDAAGANSVSDVLTVGLLAIRECWVSVTADGEKVERLMQAGERTTVEVRRELLLTAGDAAAITLTLNGADARSLGADGQVVTTKFTRQLHGLLSGRWSSLDFKRGDVERDVNAGRAGRPRARAHEQPAAGAASRI